MKKIYYLYKHLVKIGDVVEYNGIKAIVTEELILLNPELFRVEDSMQELLDKAKRDYSIGTTFKSWYPRDNFNMTIIKSDHRWDTEHNLIVVATDRYPLGATLYKDGEWAKILPLKFTTEDDVDIYGDMKTWAVDEDLELMPNKLYDGIRREWKYFFHKENALAYIEKHKAKPLEDYENILFERGNSMITSSGSVYFSVYGWLKDNEPKLYYTKILQLIADDLNNVRYIHERGQVSFHINKGGVNVHMGADEGAVYFKAKKLAEKARDILGDKVKNIFD